MCGIISYIGNKPALPILLSGLRRLEYRGYDSAGVALFDAGVITRARAVGKIDELTEKVKGLNLPGTMGIAHTRWATHGGVTEANAHPHAALGGKLVVVHNGIIENYRELREKMMSKGAGGCVSMEPPRTGPADPTASGREGACVPQGAEEKYSEAPLINFSSQTDTEVLAHLIGQQYAGDLRAAVVAALAEVRGTYGLVVMHADHPDTLVVARLGSPIVIGVGEGEHYVASDATPILPYTHKVIFLADGEIAEISRGGVQVFDGYAAPVDAQCEEIAWDDVHAEKQGFAHFMLKEIFDQPTVIQDAIRGRYDVENGTAHLGGLNMSEDEMRRVNRVIFLACGTASYAGLVGKYAFERLVGIPAEVEIASEFRYRDPVVDDRTLVFALSQSGETADTLAAVREAKRRGAFVRGIVNVVGSTIARETDGGTYIHAGPELAVASTKAYTNMVAIMILYALQFGRLRRVSLATGQRLLQALLEVPAKMQLVLTQSETIQKIAAAYAGYHNILLLGRGINFPIALEASLKIKEISYIHAEAYPGGEMKHGPIALLSPEFPVLAIMTHDQLYDKMRSNVEEVRARGARVLMVASVGDEAARALADDIIFVPETMELLQPLVTTVTLQLFAYHLAVALGKDVDRPRNLAKSVTVE